MSWAPTPAEIEAFALSLRVATVATALALPFGIAVAWVLARVEFHGKLALEALVMLPLVVPPVVTGYALLLVFGRNGLVGGWLERTTGVVFAFDWKGAALAAAVVSFPLLVRAVRVSFESQDRGLEQAARTLGAGPWRTFLTVSVPLALPGLVAGTLLAFARALGEFGATITFVGSIPGTTRTLPLAIYGYTQSPGGEAAAARLVLLSVAISLVAVALSSVGARRATRIVAGTDDGGAPRS